MTTHATTIGAGCFPLTKFVLDNLKFELQYKNKNHFIKKKEFKFLFDIKHIIQEYPDRFLKHFVFNGQSTSLFINITEEVNEKLGKGVKPTEMFYLLF